MSFNSTSDEGVLKTKKRMELYYDNNKVHINKKKNEKIVCECGLVISRTNITRHKKCIKHLKRMWL
tara:strand:- start:1620 stop:1817 length:198 start_codon:yes stop_codon:yes gene_type:complete